MLLLNVCYGLIVVSIYMILYAVVAGTALYVMNKRIKKKIDGLFFRCKNEFEDRMFYIRAGWFNDKIDEFKICGLKIDTIWYKIAFVVLWPYALVKWGIYVNKTFHRCFNV